MSINFLILRIELDNFLEQNFLPKVSLSGFEKEVDTDGKKE
jgi:hypothetical protein